MSANNYAGFNYGGSQYPNAPGANSSGYQSGQGTSYPVVTNPAYAASAAYQTAGPVGHGGYTAVGASNAAANYAYDYNRTLQSYDTSKTYYQQAPTSYNSASTASNKTHYSAPPVKNINTNIKVPGTKDKINGAGKQATAATTPIGYTSYDAALYSAAATLYVAQQQNTGNGTSVKSVGASGSNIWQGLKGRSGGNHLGTRGTRGNKPPPRPQQLHYCEVCKISCAGPQTYREHLDGQKHKKREASLKMQASAQNTNQNRGNNYHCELCDVTCTGNDAYAAHVRGSKHQKVVKLHQKLGKPIPSDEPKKLVKINFVTESSGAVEADSAGDIAEDIDNQENGREECNISLDENNDNIKPVGGEYIEEVKDDDGKIVSFNCKLCLCKFNDPNAKEMHTKGRRHRLQYKRKVQPDLPVNYKPTPRQRRLADVRAQRAALQMHRGNCNVSGFNEEQDASGMFWEEQRRRNQYDEEFDYNWFTRSLTGSQRGFGGIRNANGPLPFFGMMPGGAGLRRPESSDDRHVIAHHKEIYPKEEELRAIQRIVANTERALKFVSDSIAENPDASTVSKKGKTDTSLHKDGESKRILKGFMRVGFLAKGLLLQGDTEVELVVLCTEKPTVGLLRRVASELPTKLKLKEVAGDQLINYDVDVMVKESAIAVRDDTITVKIYLTSPLLRESMDVDTNDGKNCSDDAWKNDATLLPRDPCLQALAEFRHAKWFDYRASGLVSCVLVIRIMRDLRQRVQSWQALSQWSLELLVEKVISSAGFPLSPGDCLRRIMEAVATGFIIGGPGLLDPCEKEAQDALQGLTKQEREDLTFSAQNFLRLIAFRKIFKVLGMDQLPVMKFPMRPWRVNRKRRRSTGKSPSRENDKVDGAEKGKVFKMDEENAVPA